MIAADLPFLLRVDADGAGWESGIGSGLFVFVGLWRLGRRDEGGDDWLAASSAFRFLRYVLFVLFVDEERGEGRDWAEWSKADAGGASVVVLVVVAVADGLAVGLADCWRAEARVIR